MTFNAPFIPTTADLRPFAAELWLVIGIAANLLIPFVTRRPNYFCAGATLIALLLGAASVVGLHDSGPHLAGLLLSDSIASAWKLILFCFVAGVVLLWVGHSGRSLRQGDAPEFFVLLLGATLGMSLMTCTTHLLMIFMAIGLASMPSYLLVGFRKKNRLGAEASLKYVLFGAVTSAIMIYGMSFLYGLYGTLQLTDLISKAPLAGGSAALSLGLIGILIGVGFKISAVPFHFWCPDVFEGATIEVTTFLSVASKGAALILLLRILQISGSMQSSITVGLIGALTATVGNTAAFTQQNIKRLLAYSSIAQAGYLICLISTPSPAVPQALLLYLVIYALMNLGAFAIASVVIRRSGEKLEHFAGLGRASPLMAGSMFCCLVSLIGLPPLAGFGAKLNVLWLLARQGNVGRILVVVIVMNTALSAFYYLRIVRVMYFDPATEQGRLKNLWGRDPLGVSIAIVCAGMLVLLFFAFGPLYTALSN